MSGRRCRQDVWAGGLRAFLSRCISMHGWRLCLLILTSFRLLQTMPSSLRQKALPRRRRRRRARCVVFSIVCLPLPLCLCLHLLPACLPLFVLWRFLAAKPETECAAARKKQQELRDIVQNCVAIIVSFLCMCLYLCVGALLPDLPLQAC